MRTTILLAVPAAALLACGGTTREAQGPRSTEMRADTPVATAHPYEVKGTVRSLSGGLLGVGQGITIARQDAPSIRLHVEDGTQIKLDGKQARLADLREGDEVRAVFDFKESTPVAIEIVAKKKG